MLSWQLSEDPASSVFSLTKQRIDHTLQRSEQWQIGLASHMGNRDKRFHNSKLLQLLKQNNWILPKTVCPESIPTADTYYTDGNSNGKAGYVERVSRVWQTPFHSSQLHDNKLCRKHTLGNDEDTELHPYESTQCAHEVHFKRQEGTKY